MFELKEETKIIMEGMGIDVKKLTSSLVHTRRDMESIFSTDHKYLTKQVQKGWLKRYVNKDRHYYYTKDVLKFLKIQSPDLDLPVEVVEQDSIH